MFQNISDGVVGFGCVFVAIGFIVTALVAFKPPKR